MTEEPTKQRTRESSLSELLSPTLAESQAGIRGITLEDEVVTARELRARKRRRHTIMATALSVFAVVLIVLGVVFVQRYDINPFKNRDYSGSGNGEPVSFTIEQGESTAQIAQALKEKDIIADPGKFIDVYQKEANGKTLKAGTYELQKQMSSSSVVKNLVDSDNNILSRRTSPQWKAGCTRANTEFRRKGPTPRKSLRLWIREQRLICRKQELAETNEPLRF